MKPFDNDSDALEIGGLAIENGTERLVIYGKLDLTRDKAGLELARALKPVIDAAVDVLESDRHLPDKIAPPDKPTEVKNPFN